MGELLPSAPLASGPLQSALLEGTDYTGTEFMLGIDEAGAQSASSARLRAYALRPRCSTARLQLDEPRPEPAVPPPLFRSWARSWSDGLRLRCAHRCLAALTTLLEPGAAPHA